MKIIKIFIILVYIIAVFFQLSLLIIPFWLSFDYSELDFIWQNFHFGKVTIIILVSYYIFLKLLKKDYSHLTDYLKTIFHTAFIIYILSQVSLFVELYSLNNINLNNYKYNFDIHVIEVPKKIYFNILMDFFLKLILLVYVFIKKMKTVKILNKIEKNVIEENKYE